MATWHSQILITTDSLQRPEEAWSRESGATVEFWGVVRALEDGRQISGIDYEAHEEMARHQMEMIAANATEKFQLTEVLLHHRIGFVAVAEPSLFVRVSSGHRGAAFEAASWIVNELKKKVPIWKRPVFVRREEQLAGAQ